MNTIQTDPARANPIPVIILTGFLGSGKTTLLNHVLNSPHGLKIAVLVNDFGSVNIDSALIAGVEGETISLTNGCICCSIRGDLLAAVAGLLKRPDQPEAVIIETSGVSQPAAVASTFLQPELEPYLQLNGIIAVVDAEQGGKALDGDLFFLAMDQIGVADIVVLNKVDLVTADHLGQMRRWVREIAPNARILETIRGEAPAELLLGIGAYDPDRLVTGHAETHVHDASAAHDHAHDAHDRIFETFAWSCDAPLSMRALQKAIERLPVSIYRAKGFCYLADLPEERALIQVVGKRAALTFDRAWQADETRRTQIVFIASHGGLDAPGLAEMLDACRAELQPKSELGRLRRSFSEWLRG